MVASPPGKKFQAQLKSNKYANRIPAGRKTGNVGLHGEAPFTMVEKAAPFTCVLPDKKAEAEAEAQYFHLRACGKRLRDKSPLGPDGTQDVVRPAQARASRLMNLRPP
jgi:hypothetical protein